MNGRTRTGKIARLPLNIREELNRRLQNGEEGKGLVEWLNSLPEVQAVLNERFAGKPLSNKNLSEWNQGGYREWEVRQQVKEAVTQMDADTEGLAEAGERPFIDTLLKALAARYAVAAQALDQSDKRGQMDVQLLHRLCYDVISLRRSEQFAKRVQVDRDRLDFEREQYLNKVDHERWNWAWRNRQKILSYFRNQLEDRNRFYQMGVSDDPEDADADKQVDEVDHVDARIKESDDAITRMLRSGS